ncbi:MAG: DUF6035 family protein [Prolixibacteraceae bacterium]|jgi:hypothetical protein
MGRYERSIKIAFEKVSGEIIDADEVFERKTDAFELRRLFHEGKLKLSCCECEQELNVSGSKYDRLYFKHKPKHNFCILADGKLSPREHERFTAILKNKESDRHKELKNKIGMLLSKVDGVDINSISIDDKFIIRDNEKRRPDVYCKYKDKELVFEIQLSDLSLGYILSCYEFYKKHKIFLIWILDNFDIHNQGTLERDIKYLTKYQNFFKLDEIADTFKLACKYKFSFLTEDNKLLTKWLDKSVSLNEIKFDYENYQIYYYNFGGNRKKTEIKQEKRVEELLENERKKNAEQKLRNANIKINYIIDEIKELRQRQSQNFEFVLFKINELTEYELQLLNSRLSFNNKEKFKNPPLLQWIKKATQDDVAFIEFILTCRGIEIDVNERNLENRTAFQEIYENKNILKYIPVKSLLKRGYRITEGDIAFCRTMTNLDNDKKMDVHLYTICNNLSNRDLVDKSFLFTKLLLIIESAKRQEIIGFNYKPDEWVAFANNAIQYYSEYWEYIELAFNNYGLWDRLIELDKKGTFQKKVQTLYSKMPKQKFDFDEVFQDLYPELTNWESE